MWMSIVMRMLCSLTPTSHLHIIRHMLLGAPYPCVGRVRGCPLLMRPPWGGCGWTRAGVLLLRDGLRVRIIHLVSRMYKLCLSVQRTGTWRSAIVNSSVVGLQRSSAASVLQRSESHLFPAPAGGLDNIKRRGAYIIFEGNCSVRLATVGLSKTFIG